MCWHPAGPVHLPGGSTNPTAEASSTTAVDPRTAYKVAMGRPVGPVVFTATGIQPAATAAATVPSPPSATGAHVMCQDPFPAAEVADALAEGLAAGNPSWHITCAPVADGGDGTVAAAVAAGWMPVAVKTTGPTGRPIATLYAVRGSTAVVELASAVGLVTLPGGELDPLGASTFGLGTVIRHALDQGAREIIVGLGGSASTDGGAGMLQALGVRILDAEGNDVAPGGAALRHAARLDLSGLHPAARGAHFQLACDVDNPLLGPTGATAVYAPQKGADAEELVGLRTP